MWNKLIDFCIGVWVVLAVLIGSLVTAAFVAGPPAILLALAYLIWRTASQVGP